MPDTVIVRSLNVLKPPLLVTREAMAVEIYDETGELVAVLHKILNGKLWGLTTKGDEDWEQCLMQLGYINKNLDIVPGTAAKKGFFDG